MNDSLLVCKCARHQKPAAFRVISVAAMFIVLYFLATFLRDSVAVVAVKYNDEASNVVRIKPERRAVSWRYRTLQSAHRC